MVKRFAAYLILLFWPQIVSANSFSLPPIAHDKAVGYSRSELTTSNEDKLSGGRRRLLLEIWYPALHTSGASMKPWASRAMGQAIAREFSIQEGFEAKIATNSQVGVPPAGENIPIIVFSPGLSFPVTLYQSFAENLASRGYAVIAVNHPHTSLLIEFADGTRSDMSRWPQIEDETAREKFLSEYADVLQRDLADVLDQLPRWAQQGNNPLRGRLDLKRIGIAGHSYGGTTAARLSQDKRVGAVVVLEGVVRDPKDNKFRGSFLVGAPFLHIIGGYNRLELEKRDYLPGYGAPVYRAVINGTGHAQLSDLIYVYQFFADAEWRSRQRYALEPKRVLQIIGDYAGDFFDHYLLGKDKTVLLRPVSYSDAVDGPRSAGYYEVDLTVDVQ